MCVKETLFFLLCFVVVVAWSYRLVVHQRQLSPFTWSFTHPVALLTL